MLLLLNILVHVGVADIRYHLIVDRETVTATL